MTPLTGQQESAYIRKDSSDRSDGHEAMMHRRRRRVMVALLDEFERKVVPLIPPGHEDAIKDFKGVCRAKLNGLTWEAISLLKLKPGETLNMETVEIAEALTLDETEDQPT